MPKGPQGQKRPADVIGATVMVVKIATGEITDTVSPSSAVSELGRKDGKVQAAKLSKKRWAEIAHEAAAAP